MICGNTFIDPELVALRAALERIARLAVLSAHPGEKYQRNMQTIDRIRDIARDALAASASERTDGDRA